MTRSQLASLALAIVCLTGCGPSKSDFEAELSASRQETADLKARVGALEGRVQAIEASLPDDDGAK